MRGGEGTGTDAQDLVSYLPDGTVVEVDCVGDVECEDSQDPDDLVRRVLGHDPWHRDAAQAGRRTCSLGGGCWERHGAQDSECMHWGFGGPRRRRNTSDRWGSVAISEMLGSENERLGSENWMR